MTVHGRKGFMLIELVVVIAILALLMAILMPALQRVKKQAGDIKCRSNMRQIGMAANLYADVYNLYIPRGIGGASGQAWFQLFMPFLDQKPIGDDYRNVTMYRCPGYPDKEQTVCYVVNGWEFEGRDDKEGKEMLMPTKLSSSNRRAYAIYIADNEDGAWRNVIKEADGLGNDRCDVWNRGHLPTSGSSDIDRGRRVARNRHKNGSNCLFLDWHVEWMAADDINADMWRFRY
jgi:prepilin-type processing-associated H-X9-DG protein/prepilin-type N-terminal cleavage/methylation domain-containing protein